MERSTWLPTESARTYPAWPQDARGRDGTTIPEDDMRADLPTYTDADQGTDQDRDARATATVERAARHERNRPDRTGLIGQLNDRTSGLGGMSTTYAARLATATSGQPGTSCAS